MNIATILAVAVLVSAAVNAIHWRGRKDERFLYHPQSGWLRVFFIAWTVATIVAAVLFLAGFIAVPAFLGVALGLTAAHQLYSIARRQYQRAQATQSA
jgi:hypothetical protein